MASETREPRKVIKQVANARLYNDDTILLQNVRLSYPHVFVAYAGDDGGAPGYSVICLMPKTSHAEAKNLCVERIGLVMKANKIERLPSDKKFIRNGDEAGKPGYDGTFSVSARETKRPLVLGLDGRTELDPIREADKIYGGCWGSVLIRPWFQNNKFGKRVNANLLAVQFVRDDEPFGEGRISKDDVAGTFDNLAGDSSGFDDGLGGADDDNGGL